MGCCARAVPALLLHVNIFLVMYAGAGLVLGARLKWDPSAYVPVREVFPREYRVAAAAVPAASLALLFLAHFSVMALRTRRQSWRRVLLLMYAFLMSLMALGEAALVWWLAARALRWAHSAQADELRRALELREHLQPLLEHLAHWHPLPTKLKAIMEEAEADVPANGHVALGAALGLALLQASAVLLALLAAVAARRRQPSAPHSMTSTCTDSEKSPLRSPPTPRTPRAVYRGGRLVMA